MPADRSTRSPNRRSLAPWGRLAAAAVVAVLAVQWLAGAGAGAAPPLSPPPVPANGAYLGAWVDPGPLGSGGASAADEVAQIGELDSAFGRPLAIAHIFTRWELPPTDSELPPVSNSELAGVAATGAIPLLDWKCGDSDFNVALASPNGDAQQQADYTLIKNYATQLEAYGGPVFLRWFWEFNILGSHADLGCLDYDVVSQHLNPYHEFVLAWQKIYDIFEGITFTDQTDAQVSSGVTASNVAFVWCPGVSGVGGATLASMYPGDAYVDWICLDAYDRDVNPSTSLTVNLDHENFYKDWSTHTNPVTGEPIPIMLGETGADATNQPAYIESLGRLIGPAPDPFPDVKAVVYFDGRSGDGSPWTLGGPGLASWRDLGAEPYFSPLG